MTTPDILAFIDRLDPEFVGTIEGASDDEIQTLQQLVGRKLPPAYVRFLRTMGRSTGWIRIGYDTTTRIDRVVEYYRDYVHTGVEWVPDDCIAISVFGVDLAVCLHVAGEGEAAVVFTEANTIVQRYADSLDALLFRAAYLHYMPRRWSATRKLWNPARTPLGRQARDLATAAGFTPLWFSDSVAWCGERTGAAIVCRQYENEGLLVALASDSAADLTDTARVFERELGVRPER